MDRVRTRNERGGALVEFALLSVVWVPLLFGTIVFGFNLLGAIQLSQLCRDSGHMYAYGVDFTQPANVTLLQRLASNLNINIQQNSGDGYILFSTITLVTDADCAAAGNSTCPNRNKYVFTKLLVFGDRTNVQTSLGSPASRFLQPGSVIQISDYLNDGSLVATGFPSLNINFVPGQPGQYAFTSEVTLHSQVLNWHSFSNTGTYARSVF
jgi:hypothetical protein